MTPRESADLVVRMAGENPRWGYTRIRGALANLGHEVARNTVKRILHDHWIDPAPGRQEVGNDTSGGVQPIRLPTKSPNLNAYAERFGRSIKEECLTRVPLSEGHLRLLAREYVEHYHRERNHQGLDNRLLQRAPPPRRAATDVRRRERLGGLLNFYQREVA